MCRKGKADQWLAGIKDGEVGVTANAQGICGSYENVLRLCWGSHNSVNILITTEWHTLSGWMACYVNFISVKLLYVRERERLTDSERESLASYWFQGIPTTNKLEHTGRNYLWLGKSGRRVTNLSGLVWTFRFSHWIPRPWEPLSAWVIAGPLVILKVGKPVTKLPEPW